MCPQFRGLHKDNKLLPDHGRDIGSCSEYRVGPALSPFCPAQRVSSDAAIEAFLASYRKLYPRSRREAQQALVGYVYDINDAF